MNIYSFFSENDFEDIRKCVEKREPFEKEGSHKCGKHTVHLRLAGRKIRQEYVDIWHGNDYLIDFQENYEGGGQYSGHGFATDEYSIMDSWGSFKDWIDKNMAWQYKNYETEVYGQTTLF